MQARAYPWSTLSTVRREDVSAAAALRRWGNAFVRFGGVAQALSGLLDARVDVRIDRVRRGPFAAGAEEWVGLLLGAGDPPDAARAALLELEPALGVALVARALRRVGPRIIAQRTLSEAFPGAIAAIAAATARRVSAQRPLRILGAGSARALEREIAAAGEAIEAALIVTVNDDTFTARVLIPAAVAYAAPAPAWTRENVLALGDVPIALPVVAAVSRSTAGEVGTLRRGDGWVPGGWGLRRLPSGALEGPVFLAAAGAERGIGALLSEDGRLVIRDAGGPLAWTLEKREEGVGEGEIDRDALVEAVGEVPVVVRVEVGVAEMRAREWASLGPGDVVALGRNVGDAVTLRVGGITVARGELVDLEGEIAVRILGRTDGEGRAPGQERNSK